MEKTSQTTPEKSLINQQEVEVKKSAVNVVEMGENKILEESSQLGERSGEQNVGKKEIRELKEGQINEWETVYAEKAGKSPKSHDLKYGHVTIASPSRFAALRNSDEKGEEAEEIQDKEETQVVEEVETGCRGYLSKKD